MRALEGTPRPNAKRVGRRSAVIVAASAVAIGVAGGTSAAAHQSAWQRALHVRSEALNKHYARFASNTPPVDWRRGLHIRSAALNDRYGLSGSALNTLSRQTSSWQYGLWVRSDALNRAYQLGTYGTVTR